MIRGVTKADVHLLELQQTGRTGATADALAELRQRGLVSILGGKATLTKKGRRRAERLRSFEHDLKLAFSAAPGRAAFYTGG